MQPNPRSSNFSIQVYKNINSSKSPEISLPTNLPQSDLSNPVLIKTAKDLFAENGVLIIKNLFSKDLIAQLNQAFFQEYQGYFVDKEYEDALEVGVKRKMVTVKLQAPFNNPDLYGNPLLMYLMRALLGRDFILGSFGAVIALPGAEQQHIHQDHPALFEDEALDLQLPSFAVTLVVPLIDLTPATGSTQVWKGSHRLSPLEEFAKDTSSIPFVPTGSCYLMDYQLWHGGTPNISNQIRPILYIVYYRSWFQETVNYEQQARVSISEREYEKIPETYKFLFVRAKEFFNQKAIGNRQKVKENSYLDTVVEEESRAQRSQVLYQIAQQALIDYGFEGASVQLISNGENTVFAVDVSKESSSQKKDYRYAASRFVLRIHRVNYLSIESIESELRWLKFLSQEAQMPVSETIPTLEGKLFTLVKVQGLAEPRVCSLTRWLNGHAPGETTGQSQPLQLESVGRLLGQLHHHAEHWPIPEGFTRPRWDWNGLFGDMAGYSNNGTHVWELTPQPYRNLFSKVSQQFKETVALLKEDSSQFGLIHGDFWVGNLLINEQEIGLIDFADCGFGYWMYDLARFLNDYISVPDFPLYLDKLLQGYSQIKPFPEEQLHYLQTFIAAQYASYGLWQVNRAQDHPSFRAGLDKELEETAVGIEQLMTRHR